MKADTLEAAVALAFADVADDLREQFPDVYEKVDAILADPERRCYGAVCEVR